MILAETAPKADYPRGSFNRFVGVRIPEEVYAQLEAHAAEAQITVSAYIRQLLMLAGAQEVCTWKRIGDMNAKFVAGEFVEGWA